MFPNPSPWFRQKKLKLKKRSTETLRLCWNVSFSLYTCLTNSWQGKRASSNKPFCICISFPCQKSWDTKDILRSNSLLSKNRLLRLSPRYPRRENNFFSILFHTLSSRKSPWTPKNNHQWRTCHLNSFSYYPYRKLTRLKCLLNV